MSKDFSTHFALFDTHCAQNSKKPRQQALQTLFFTSNSLEGVEALLVYGLDANALSSPQVMSHPLFGSRLYELLVAHGRDPHRVRESYYLSAVPCTNPLARLSDLGYGIWAKGRLPWGKLRAKGVVDWNKPSAQFEDFAIKPLDFALLTGDVGLAHTMFRQNATLGASHLLPQMVERFLQHAWKTAPTHAYVLKEVWGKISELDETVCRTQWGKIGSQDLGGTGVEERKAQLTALLWGDNRPTNVEEKRQERRNKRKTTKTSTHNARQAWIDKKSAEIWQLSAKQPHEALRQAMAMEDNFQLAQRILDTHGVDFVSPYTVKSYNNRQDEHPPLCMTVLPNATPAVVRFLIKNGLRGDTLVERGNGRQQLALDIFLSYAFVDGARQKRLDSFRALVNSCHDINTTDSNGEHVGFALVRHNRLPLEWFTELVVIAMRKGMVLTVCNHTGQSMEEVAHSRQNTTHIQLLQNLKSSHEKNLLHTVLEEMERGTSGSAPTVAKRRM